MALASTVDEPRHERLRRRLIFAAAAAFAILLLVTLVVLKPAMPDRITLLAGPAGSADHDLAQSYARDLRRRGLEADVVVTEGELDSMDRLSQGADAVAFLPAVLLSESDSSEGSTSLVTLGSIGLSPFWLFHRSDLEITSFRDLSGRAVATEGAGTAGDRVARKLIDANDLTGEAELRAVAGQTAPALIEGFRTGTLDAAFVTGAANSPIVRALLDADEAAFVSFDRVEAYAALIPGAISITAPEGVFDLGRNVPSQDSQLLATTTCLVSHEGLHRAVAPMLLVTAENVVDKTTTFSTPFTFPSREHLTLPLDPGARRFFDQGETGLSRFLPYKVARLVRHIGFVVLPLLTVAGLLLRFVPAGIRVWSGMKLKRMLKQLEAVEKGYAKGRDREELLGDLGRIDRATATMFVPRSTVHDYIDCRQFLHDMRERVAGGDAEETHRRDDDQLEPSGQEHR
jgi:TRAP-type uncharacterized transport system substrate-binding protein